MIKIALQQFNTSEKFGDFTRLVTNESDVRKVYVSIGP